MSYTLTPAPKANPEGRLDLQWIIRDQRGKIRGRAASRDLAEEKLAALLKVDEKSVEAEISESRRERQDFACEILADVVRRLALNPSIPAKNAHTLIHKVAEHVTGREVITKDSPDERVIRDALVKAAGADVVRIVLPR